MLKERQMQEIQDLKLRGYSINEIVKYYEEQGKKPPSLPTIRKYYQMDSMPEVPNQNLIKDKDFDHKPYRSAVIEIVRNNHRSSYCAKIMYGETRRDVVEILKKLCEMKQVTLVDGRVCKDHVHMYLGIPPKLSIRSYGIFEGEKHVDAFRQASRIPAEMGG